MASTLVIAYDDSPDARLALEAAGAMHPGWNAIVVHAWQASPTPTASTGPAAPLAGDALSLDDAELERRARAIAEDGVDRARRAGLQATPEVRPGGSARDVADAVLAVAAEHAAELVVAGRRGLGPVRAAVLGSVSDALVRHAPLPVLVVPESG